MDADFEGFLDGWWPLVITTVISVIAGIRVYAGGAACPSSQRIDGKITLITGASSGIGFETAKELAARGAHVILTCRNAIKGRDALTKIRREVHDARIDLRILDVSLLNSIQAFVKSLAKDYSKIDILINNAGIIFHPFKKTAENVELTFATNYLGPFFLTHQLLPLLKNSENGRVINVTALAHHAGKINFNDLFLEENFEKGEAYAQSKLALMLFTKHMASLYKDTKITFNSANPGLVRNTEHISRTFGQSLKVKISVWPWVWLFLKTPKQGCQTSVFLAVEPALTNISGCYFSDCERKDPSDKVNDLELAEKLYQKTKKLCEEVDYEWEMSEVPPMPF